MNEKLLYKLLKPFIHGETFLPEFIATWRVIVGAAITELAGGLIGTFYSYFNYWFFNFWLGAAIAALPGTMLGIVWAWRSDPAGIRDHWGIVVFYFFLALLLLFASIFLFETNFFGMAV